VTWYGVWRGGRGKKCLRGRQRVRERWGGGRGRHAGRDEEEGKGGIERRESWGRWCWLIPNPYSSL
jgi:hypothetical protein